MKSWEGVQFETKKDAETFVRKRRIKPFAKIIKENKPSWWSGGWKPLYSIQKRRR